jgi:hypothetical protein
MVFGIIMLIKGNESFVIRKEMLVWQLQVQTITLIFTQMLIPVIYGKKC